MTTAPGLAKRGNRCGLPETRNRGYIRNLGSGNGAIAADGATPKRTRCGSGVLLTHRLLDARAADPTSREQP